MIKTQLALRIIGIKNRFRATNTPISKARYLLYEYAYSQSTGLNYGHVISKSTGLHYEYFDSENTGLRYGHIIKTQLALQIIGIKNGFCVTNMPISGKKNSLYDYFDIQMQSYGFFH